MRKRCVDEMSGKGTSMSGDPREQVIGEKDIYRGRRHLLMVHLQAFKYGWMGSTGRLFDLAEGLAERDWMTTLLTAREGGARDSDPGGPEGQFPGRLVRGAFAPGPWPKWLDRRGLRSAGLKLAECLPYDNKEAWLNSIASGREGRELRSEAYAAVWAVTLYNTWNAEVGRRLSREFSCPLVIEFQDPVPAPHATLSRREQATLVLCLGDAALVVTTSEAYASHLEERYEVARGKTMTVYLSHSSAKRCSGAKLAGRAAGQRLEILHTGFLYGRGGRNVLGVLEGISWAYGANEAARGRISLRLMGGGPGFEEARRCADSLGIGEALTCVPPGSREEAADAEERADMLLVVKFPDPAFDMQIPGKLFKYLGYGKPILGIMEECEAAEILRKSGLGVVASSSDSQRIGRILLQALSRTDSAFEGFRPVPHYIERFSRSTMAASLDEKLRALRP